MVVQAYEIHKPIFWYSKNFAFFPNGETAANSMIFFKFSRLVAEVQTNWNGIQLQNDDVYIASGFEEFAEMVILMCRGTYRKKEFQYDAVSFKQAEWSIYLFIHLFIY